MKMLALVSDLDMTLIDSRRDISIAMAKALSALSHREISEQDIAKVIGKGLPKLFAEFAPDAPYPTEKFWEGVKNYQEYYKPNCNVYTTVYPGVIETLNFLMDHGIKMAVASNKWGSMAQHVCNKNGIETYFSHFQGIEHTPGKPKPDIIQKSCIALSVKPEKAVYVGDKMADVQAGKAAGCYTVAVSYGLDSVQSLKKEEPDLLIDRFDQLLALFDSCIS